MIKLTKGGKAMSLKDVLLKQITILADANAKLDYSSSQIKENAMTILELSTAIAYNENELFYKINCA